MKIIKYLISIPKTILFNFRIFPFKVAIKLPVLIAYNVKVANISKNCILINSKISRFMIKINTNSGSEGVNISYKKTGYFDIRKEGKIIFNGNANFSNGISIRVDSGNLIFGNNFSCNKNCFFSCSKGITFGNNVLLGWNINIRDADGHNIFDLNDLNIGKSSCKSVSIGNHVWIASNVNILKGVEIADNCVVGYNSCVTKRFMDKNCIIAGYPAKIVKNNINWKK
ncbi:acyltransferase [Clostridium pasteurianum]|uniref:acyltransferase n=1 Tax=Clostridium pasteurianum TaxID=1501 RepID=UPI002260C18C|nr:acyltransferase [Clostridium pasteurianum]UZW14978.1 acyltransferase [Clostridium pasteurianum]